MLSTSTMRRGSVFEYYYGVFAKFLCQLYVTFWPPCDLLVVVSEPRKENVTLSCSPLPPDESLARVKWFLDGDLLKELPECSFKWVSTQYLHYLHNIYNIYTNYTISTLITQYLQYPHNIHTIYTVSTQHLQLHYLLNIYTISIISPEGAPRVQLQVNIRPLNN